MPFVEWNHALATHQAEVDGQHQELVVLLNTLSDTMREGKPRTQVGEVVDELIGKLQQHFADEERLMAESAYHRLAEHQAVHESIERQMLDFQARFRNGSTSVSINLLQFVKALLASHIQEADRPFGEFLRERRAAVPRS